MSNHELSLVVAKSANLDQMPEELTALNEVHQEIDACLVTEHVVHADDEGVVHLVQDLLLQLEGVHVLILEDHVLSNALHGVNLF